MQSNKPASTSRAIPKIGVQLWSVKDDVKKDFKATLQTIADLGFEGVEFAGEFGPFADDPKALNAFLHSLHLTVSAAHVAFSAVDDKNFQQTVDFYQDLGVDTLIIAWDERAWESDGVKQVVSELNLLAEKLAPFGMRIGFHNHDKEFNSFGNATYWDYIANNTRSDVVLQLDVGWVRYAGQDPLTLVNKHPGRILTTHFKIRTPAGRDDISPVIGQNPPDEFHWPALIQADIAVGGTRWFVVEQEEYPEGMMPLQAVAASKNGLIEILKQMAIVE